MKPEQQHASGMKVQAAEGRSNYKVIRQHWNYMRSSGLVREMPEALKG